MKPPITQCSLTHIRPAVVKKGEASRNKVSSPPRCFSSTTSMSMVTPTPPDGSRLNQLHSLLAHSNIALKNSPESLSLVALDHSNTSQQPSDRQDEGVTIATTTRPSKDLELQLNLPIDITERPVKAIYHIMGPFTIPKLSFILTGMSSEDYENRSRHIVDFLCQQKQTYQTITYSTTACYMQQHSRAEFLHTSTPIIDAIKRTAALHILKAQYGRYFDLPRLLSRVLKNKVFGEEQLANIDQSLLKNAFTSVSLETRHHISKSLQLNIGRLANHVNDHCIIPRFCNDNIALDCMLDVTQDPTSTHSTNLYIFTLLESLQQQNFEHSLLSEKDFEQLYRKSYTNDLLVDIILMHLSVVFNTFYGTITFCASPFMFLEVRRLVAQVFYSNVANCLRSMLESREELLDEPDKLECIDLLVFPVCSNNHWFCYLYIGSRSRLSRRLASVCNRDAEEVPEVPPWVGKIIQCNSLSTCPIDSEYENQIVDHMNSLHIRLLDLSGSQCESATLSGYRFGKTSVVPVRVQQQKDQYSCAYHMFLVVFSLLSTIRRDYTLPGTISARNFMAGDWRHLYKSRSANAMKYWVLQHLINNATYEDRRGDSDSGASGKQLRVTKRGSLGPGVDALSSTSDSVVIVSDE